LRVQTGQFNEQISIARRDFQGLPVRQFGLGAISIPYQNARAPAKRVGVSGRFDETRIDDFLRAG